MGQILTTAAAAAAEKEKKIPSNLNVHR